MLTHSPLVRVRLPAVHVRLPALECPQCCVRLHLKGEQLACGQCGAIWPIDNGILCFSKRQRYWGELSQANAESLLSDAAQFGWRAACEQHFRNKAGMMYSVTAWRQRASWLALVGLNENSIVLDVGSGYGAITHALAKAAGEVYSVEAVPERIEFTRLRLEQEGLANVHLLRASATELPLPEKLFDLVVVNGVLEWVGEWDTTRDPRDVQLRFLRRIQRSLKPSGTLIVGIENRIGYDMLRGGMDHSGIPYLSLLPRPVASFVLSHTNRKHYRTELNSHRKYRTYTYSELGYMKLLNESGLRATFYWACPGYNQPRSLVPVKKQFLAAHALSAISDPSLGSRPGRWRRLLKLKLTRLGLLRPFIPDFLIIARRAKDSARNISNVIQNLNSLLPNGSRIEFPLQYLCSTNGEGKSVILVTDGGTSGNELVIKACPAGETLESEILTHLNLSILRAQPGSFAVPASLGSFALGGFSYAVETGAPGQQVSTLILSRAPTRRLGCLNIEVRACADVVPELARVLKSENVRVPRISSNWLAIPSSVRLDEEITSCITTEASRWRAQGIRAHGDFTIENIFWQSPDRPVTVIDWEHVLEGVPPLFDVMTLLLSAVPALALKHRETRNPNLRAEQQFLAAFFGSDPWSRANAEILLNTSARMGITNVEIWNQFLLSLVIRTNYLFSRKSKLGVQYSRLAELAAKHRTQFCVFAEIQ